MTQRYEKYKDSGVQWLGEIPEHWECVRLKHTGTSRNGLTYSPTDEVSSGLGHLVLRSSNIQDGKLCFEDNVYVSKTIDDTLFLKKDDILICSRNGSRDLVGKLVRIKEDLNCSFGAFMMVYRTNKWSPFMSYSLQIVISSYKNLFSTSTINQLVKSKFDNFYTPLPPLHEQHAIVSYLDSKCGKIDEWLSKKQKEVEHLQELKQRIIADAVTRGLNPVVKMKETNTPWLPEVPEHWEVKTLRNFITMFSEKGHKDKQLLSVTREQGVIERNTESKEENHNFIPEDLSNYKYVQKGDFVINKMKSWQGSYGVSNFDGIVSPAYFTCKLFGVNKNFFSTAIRSKVYVSFFGRYSKGIRVDQWDLSPIALKSIPFLLPPLEEQRQIVSYITEKTSKIDTLITNINKEIENIKEYKQRLISDVVTGQIKVC